MRDEGLPPRSSPDSAPAGRTLSGELPAAVVTEAAEREAVFGWLVRLRFLAAAGVAAVLLLAGPGFGRLAPGAQAWLWGVWAALLGYNALLAAFGPAWGWRRDGHLAAQLVIDCLALAALVHFAGGVENPFLLLFVLHVVNANLALRPRAAAFILLVAIALPAAVVLGEGAGLLEHSCLHPEGQPCAAARLSLWTFGVLGGLGLTLVASSAFARTLTGRLRESQRWLAATVDRLFTEKTRLKEARSAAEEERSRLQAVIDCMADAVTFCDAEGRVLLSNQRARELRHAGGATFGQDPTAPRAVRAVFEAVERGRGVPPQPAFERGGRSWESSCSVVRDAQGRPLGLVVVSRDVSDRLALERRLMHEERMSVVGKLAAAVAHEINNPIGVVSLYAQHALEKLPPDSPVVKHLETIRRNAESCRKITGGLLELSRPRTPERRPVDLREVCRDVAQSVEPLAQQAGVAVAEESRAGAPPLWVEGDAVELRQAALNLTLNAIEACAAGDRVWLRAYETQDREATVRAVEVGDTGPGIEPGLVEQIFQPFFTTKDAGTGLGLAVVDGIAKGHGGRVDVKRGPERGTVFRILLPPGGGA